MAIDYENIFWDFVLDPLRDLCISEYNYGKIYIAPEIQHKDPFSIRIWGLSADKEEYAVDAHMRQFNIELVLYMIEANPGEDFYKQFYNDGERLHQLLFDNKTKSTTVDATTYTWIDGSADSMEINELVGVEEEIEGLHTIKINFNCKLTISV